MQTAISVLLIVVAIIHLLPLPGVLGAARLSALYGIPVEEPNLAILLRHRAVLFGLLGVFLGYSAFRPDLQPLAFAAGFVSVFSFLLLARAEGGYNGALRRVVIADVVALASLVIALALYLVAAAA
jgi:hypothetical protein